MAVLPEDFWHALDRTPIRDFREYTFVDLGSGKGRAALLASCVPFRRILAVEMAPELHAIAERNAQTFQHPERCCRDIQCLCLDARFLDFPETPLVVYMWNPFWGDVMRTVARNLAASYERNPRPIYLVYLNPICDELLLEAGFLRLHRSLASVAPGVGLSVFQVLSSPALFEDAEAEGALTGSGVQAE